MPSAFRLANLTWPLTEYQLKSLDDMLGDVYQRLKENNTAAGDITVNVEFDATAFSHEILSETHTDSTAAAAANGDILTRQAGAWARLAKGSDGQFLTLASGAPTWGATTSETVVTTTGNIDDLNFSNASIIRMNNATLATIRGLAAGVAGQRVTIVSIGAGQVDLAHQNVGSGAGNRLLNTVSSGNTPLAPGVGTATYQYDATTARWRLITHRQGLAMTRTFSAGDFFAGGTQTWSVDAADVVVDSYQLDGNMVEWTLRVASTTVGGVANSELRCTIPGGFSCATSAQLTCLVGNKTSAFVMGGCGPVSATTYIRVVPDLFLGGNWDVTSVNQTFVSWHLRFPVT